MAQKIIQMKELVSQNPDTYDDLIPALCQNATNGVLCSNGDYGQLSFNNSNQQMIFNKNNSFIEQKILIHYGKVSTSTSGSIVTPINISLSNGITLNVGDILEFDIKSTHDTGSNNYYKRIILIFDSPQGETLNSSYQIIYPVSSGNITITMFITENSIQIAGSIFNTFNGDEYIGDTQLLRITKIVGSAQ